MNKLIYIAATLLLLGSPLVSAESLPEIVVTADLRESTILKSASSVTVVTEQVIESRGAQHFEDIINSLPNVNFAAGSNRARYFQIRGIGERSQFVNPLNPSVGVLVDDVDFSGAGTIATMMDVAQVEVLRGPQGTRYGANALAGLINIKTNEPEDATYARIKLSAGTQDMQTVGLVANAPLNDVLWGRFAVETHKSDGHIDNVFLDTNTMDRDEAVARGKLRWFVTNDWDLSFTAAKIDIDNGYDAFSLDNVRETLSDEPGFDRQDSSYMSVRSNWRSNGFDAVLLFNHAVSDLDYGYDEDWTFTGIHPDGYTSTDHYFRERETTSAEVRLLSTDESRLFADTTDWVFGIYYLTSDENLERQYTFAAADFFSSYDFDTLALFTQLDTALTDRLTLSTGLRFERRDTTYDDSEGVAFSPDDSLWGGKLALEYLFNNDTMIYGSISRGYKAGGFNTDGTLDADLRSFDEEYLIEYEIGLKSLLADGDASLQAAVFYDSRHDQQVKSSLVRVRADNTTEFIDFFGNAASGTNRGIEVELDWAISDHWRLQTAAAWLDAEFDDFINEFGEDLSGREQAHAPGYMFSTTLSYNRGPWFANVSADAKDEFYFSDRHSVQSDSYVLYNASAGYRADSWQVMLWGRNLGDEDYFVRAFGSFGNDPRKLYVTEPYFQFGEARVAGVTLSFDLGDR